MAGNAIAVLTPLLLAGAEVGVVHRQPNQVGLVLVQLGGELLSQLGDFRLVLLADVDPPGRRRGGRGREKKEGKKRHERERVREGDAHVAAERQRREETK